MPHRLTAAGFEPEATETVLIGLAEDLAAGVPSPSEGVVVRQVSDDADMHRIAAMESEVWNEDWSRLAADLIARTRGGGITVLVVEAGGRIVSAAWLVFNAGTEFAGLWGGSTLASWRGRGLYRTLVARRAALAVAQVSATCKWTPPTTAARSSNSSASPPSQPLPPMFGRRQDEERQPGHPHTGALVNRG